MCKSVKIVDVKRRANIIRKKICKIKVALGLKEGLVYKSSKGLH